MGGSKMKQSPLRGVTLAALTLTAVVMACDTEAPTALDDALLDVLADPEAAVNADGADDPGAIRIRDALGDQAPLIFVDGVELEAGSEGLSSLNPDDIESIEVIKGDAAADLYGERAEHGVIRILTIESPGG
ncbi:MAG: TonB-dependent receptor plug domain-containing protein [Gammaproteobacteria bacterium]|nr:TonB-dependent receptor plug domain-containing protein [Gammaproteobacteria bacterium]MYF60655.1 TonB-dependent receptor plug domain-containing protein [Gammaproteobacteria bacterium]MYI23804.1 TonB-dependent receptor plug domain-containing protein [Gammaproteobacteria bacterium]